MSADLKIVWQKGVGGKSKKALYGNDSGGKLEKIVL